MIINFLDKSKKNNPKDKNENLVKMLALLIHAARIDENYSDEEKKLIVNYEVYHKQFLKYSLHQENLPF